MTPQLQIPPSFNNGVSSQILFNSIDNTNQVHFKDNPNQSKIKEQTETEIETIHAGTPKRCKALQGCHKHQTYLLPEPAFEQEEAEPKKPETKHLLPKPVSVSKAPEPEPEQRIKLPFHRLDETNKEGVEVVMD